VEDLMLRDMDVREKGLIKGGGGNGGNCPGLPAARRPPGLNLFVSTKILV